MMDVDESLPVYQIIMLPYRAPRQRKPVPLLANIVAFAPPPSFAHIVAEWPTNRSLAAHPPAPVTTRPTVTTTATEKARVATAARRTVTDDARCLLRRSWRNERDASGEHTGLIGSAHTVRLATAAQTRTAECARRTLALLCISSAIEHTRQRCRTRRAQRTTRTACQPRLLKAAETRDNRGETHPLFRQGTA
jgi:hypothetical protein